MDGKNDQKPSRLALWWLMLWAQRRFEDEVKRSYEEQFKKLALEDISEAKSWILCQAIKAPFDAFGVTLSAIFQGLLQFLDTIGSVFDRASKLLWALIVLLVLIGMWVPLS